MTSDPAELEGIPATIDGYKVKEVVSRGASAVLLKVVDAEGVTWALKFIPNASPGDRKFLAREAQNLQKLNSPRVSKFKEIVESGSGSGIVMEFVPGQNLAQMKKELPLRGILFRSFAIAVLDAVRSIHSVGLIHRDLKPENVVFGEDGVKVVDFGISLASDSLDGEDSGTPTWISPEQAKGEPASEASDVFNLGLLLAFASSGTHPFGTGAADAILYRLINKEPNLSEVPETLREPIEAALEKDPGRRPDLETLSIWVSGVGNLSGEVDSQQLNSTVVASRTILGRVAQSESVPARAEKPPKVRSKNYKWVLSLVSLLVIFFGGGGLAGYLYFGQVLPASGPVVVEVKNLSSNSTRGGSFIEVTNGLFEQELEFAERQKTRVFTLKGDLNWSLDSRLSFVYSPSFSDDENFDFILDPRSLGANRFMDGLIFKVQIDLGTEETTVQIIGPKLDGVTIISETFMSKSLARGNEFAAIRSCTNNEIDYLESVAKEHKLADGAWRTIYAESGLEYDGSLYYSTWASRATKAIDAVYDLQLDLILARDQEGSLLYKAQLEVEDNLQDLLDAITAFRSASWAENGTKFDDAWSAHWDARWALEDAVARIDPAIDNQADNYCESLIY